MKNKTRLTRACRNLAEMEDEKTMVTNRKSRVATDVETSSKMRQNREEEEEEKETISSCVTAIRRQSDVETFKRKLRGGKESGRFRMLVRREKKLSEEVENAWRRAEDARV